MSRSTERIINQHPIDRIFWASSRALPVSENSQEQLFNNTANIAMDLFPVFFVVPGSQPSSNTVSEPHLPETVVTTISSVWLIKRAKRGQYSWCCIRNISCSKNPMNFTSGWGRRREEADWWRPQSGILTKILAGRSWSWTTVETETQFPILITDYSQGKPKQFSSCLGTFWSPCSSTQDIHPW